MKLIISKVEVDFGLATVRQYPKLLTMHDYNHNTSGFLASLLDLKQNNFGVGIAYFEPGLDKILNVSAKGLCVAGHPVSLAQSNNGVFVNAFTTLKSRVSLPADVQHVSNFNFKEEVSVQGYHKNGVVIPKAGIRDFKPLNLPKDMTNEDLLKTLQEYIKIHGERAVLMDLFKLINEESSTCWHVIR